MFVGIHFCKAQDTTVLLSPGMFDTTSRLVFLSKMNGWLFRPGNDTAWAKKDLDPAGWKRLKPAELSAKYADKSGRVECWFRIKIKLDAAFANTPIGFRNGTWAATDLYIDDNLVSSSSNTGKNGTPFKESRRSYPNPVPLNLKPGNVYTIALHIVDYTSPMPPLHLKSEDGGLQFLAVLTTPDFNLYISKNVIQVSTYETIWIAVCIILSLLFWLLFIQNRNEKNLRLIALCSTFFALAMWCLASDSFMGISYVSFLLYNYASGLFVGMIFIVIPLILANIFKRKVSRILKVFLIVLFIALNAGSFLPPGPGTILIAGSTLVLIAVCIYYIVSSWKRLKGAQWAIVAGLLLSLISILLYFFIVIEYNNQYVAYFYVYITGFVLSFPLSLLVYVAMRFKEIIKEVNQNAQQVVQLSDEKKEQALNQQKILEEEINRQTAEIRTTLNNLKSTQSQLIQSEKMASLGELTAGIAHEIQNPLNFVNNFSEVNSELIGEMKEELANGNIDEAKTIADDIDENEQKIIFHGKRADAIVKGMLQHSRASSGQKEPTDINTLADEYLRLSYHGLRAKDKSFTAILKTDFDEGLSAGEAGVGKINIVPQDIGRVLLNLFNNAFYAVNEKAKTLQLLKGSKEYEPTVMVSTKSVRSPSGGLPAGRQGLGVLLTVKDNGNGIPQKVLDKIFQPFFTTKPAGEGTGLGLSLSYDIIKAHGGEIKVGTKEGEGSEFVIQLPIA